MKTLKYNVKQVFKDQDSDFDRDEADQSDKDDDNSVPRKFKLRRGYSKTEPMFGFIDNSKHRNGRKSLDHSFEDRRANFKLATFSHLLRKPKEVEVADKEKAVLKVTRYVSQTKITDRSHEGFGKHKEWKQMRHLYPNFQDLLPFNTECEGLLYRLKPGESKSPTPEAQLDVISKIFRLFHDFKFVREVNI